MSSTAAPSDAAMAAVREWNATGRIFCGSDATVQYDNEMALVIDKAFAPLRDELARWKDVAEAASRSCLKETATVATLRASNAKLRAALEKVGSMANATDADAALPEAVCIAQDALASTPPEAMQPPPNTLPHA